jgi:hypothetical protein
MVHKIDAATANGIDMFLFDWYWYASPVDPTLQDLQGPGGGPFLAGALENGFLKAPNNEQMEFALMWANQDWVDVHPAKAGWHGTYRQHPSLTDSEKPVRSSIYDPQPTGKPQELLLFDGFMNRTVYNNAFKYIAKNYFTKSNYYRVPTKLANGNP